MKYLVFITITLCAIDLYAADNKFFLEKYRGWYWFEEKEKREEKEIKPLESNAQELNQSDKYEIAKDELGKLQQEVENKKAYLITKPSVENAKDYMEAQARLFARSDEVSKAWQLALLKYPYLNNQISDPVNQHAINIKRNVDKEKDELLIIEFGREYGLIFFFRSDCRYCHEFAPVLARFASFYDVSIAAISMDGGVIEGFDSKMDENLVAQFNVQITPSLFAYSPSKNKAFPVGSGFLSQDELVHNLTFVINTLKTQGKYD
jgi:conjugal transfer pilus assembly protein TraF